MPTAPLVRPLLVLGTTGPPAETGLIWTRFGSRWPRAPQLGHWDMPVVQQHLSGCSVAVRKTAAAPNPSFHCQMFAKKPCTTTNLLTRAVPLYFCPSCKPSNRAASTSELSARPPLADFFQHCSTPRACPGFLLLLLDPSPPPPQYFPSFYNQAHPYPIHKTHLIIDTATLQHPRRRLAVSPSSRQGHLCLIK